MSDEARENGWSGFDNAGSVTQVPGGWEYRCDGMPSAMGCGASRTISRRYTRVGLKGGGWLVCYGLEPDTDDTPFDDTEHWHPDTDVVLVFCPSCATVVLGS